MYKVFLIWLVFLIVPSAQAKLHEIDLSSPEATYQTFYKAMSDYSKAVKENSPNLKKRLLDAIETFETEPQADSSYTKTIQKDRAIYLKEIIDRVVTKPRSPVFKNNHIEGTNIFFVKKNEWFYISLRSLNLAESNFESIKNLPYQKAALHPGASHKPSFIKQFLPAENFKVYFGLTKTQWILILFSLTTALIIYYSLSLFLIVFEKIIFRTRDLSFEIVSALTKPLSTLFATAFLKAMGANMGLTGTASYVWNSFIQILLSIGFFWIIYCLITPMDRALRKVTAKTESDLDDQLVPLVSKTAKIAVVFLAILSIVQSLGVNIFSLLAGVGVGGLALALAAKDTAANLFGSLMILFDQPFKIGDWIKIADMEGTVEDIGFRSTRIRTFYDSQIVIPNATVAAGEIDNLGRRKYRRTVETLGLTYSTSKADLEAFISGVKDILKAHPKTKDEKSYVSFKRFGDSSLEVLLYFFLDVINYDEELKGKEELFLEIKVLAERIGVEFAYPSQSLYIEKGGASLC